METDFERLRLEDLKIVGYADPPPEYLYPGLVAPLFQELSGERDLIVPPYEFVRNALKGGHRESESVLKKMVWLKTAVKIDQPITPKEGFALWIDEDGCVKYEPKAETLAFLTRYSTEKLSAARKSFENGEDKETLILAQRALNADESCIESVRLMQEVYRKQDNLTFVDELEHLAKSIESRR